MDTLLYACIGIGVVLALIWLWAVGASALAEKQMRGKG